MGKITVPDLTPQRLRQLLEYDPATGVFTRLISLKGRNARAGDIAGSPHIRGYWAISIDAKLYLAHRLAWFYMARRWPREQIDHKNGDRLDNRWSNLREATPAQNNFNSKKPKNNTSGFKCVAWHKKLQRWRAYITINDRHRHIGLFDNKEDAHAAYCRAAKELRGEFARFA